MHAEPSPLDHRDEHLEEGGTPRLPILPPPAFLAGVPTAGGAGSDHPREDVVAATPTPQLSPRTLDALYDIPRAVSIRCSHDPALRDPRFLDRKGRPFLPELLSSLHEGELIFRETLSPCLRREDTLARQRVISDLLQDSRREQVKREKDSSYQIGEAVFGCFLAQVQYGERGETMSALTLARMGGGYPPRAVEEAKALVAEGLRLVKEGAAAFESLCALLENSPSPFLSALATDLRGAQRAWPTISESTLKPGGVDEMELERIGRESTLLLSRLGAFIELAGLASEQALGRMSCDVQAPAEYKEGYNLVCLATKSHRNDSPAPNRLTLFTGSNMSGKTESGLKQNFFIQLLGQAWGFSTVGSGNIHHHDSFFYFDRGATATRDGLSAFGDEIVNYRENLPLLGERPFGCIDEGGSTTSPEDQAEVLERLTKHPKLAAARIFLSSHNEELNQRFSRDPEIGTYYFSTTVSPDGRLNFLYTLTPGVGDSNSIQVAERLAADGALIARAKSARDGTFQLKSNDQLPSVALPAQGIPPSTTPPHGPISQPGALPYTSIVPPLERNYYRARDTAPTAVAMSKDDDFRCDSSLNLSGAAKWISNFHPLQEGRYDGLPSPAGVKRLLLEGAPTTLTDVLARQAMFRELADQGSHEKICRLVGRIEYAISVMPWAIQGLEVLTRLPHSISPFTDRGDSHGPMESLLPLVAAYRELVEYVGGNEKIVAKLSSIERLAQLAREAEDRTEHTKLAPLFGMRERALAQPVSADIVADLTKLAELGGAPFKDPKLNYTNPTQKEALEILSLVYSLPELEHEELRREGTYWSIYQRLGELPRDPLEESVVTELKTLLTEKGISTPLAELTLNDLRALAARPDPSSQESSEISSSTARRSRRARFTSATDTGELPLFALDEGAEQAARPRRMLYQDLFSQVKRVLAHEAQVPEDIAALVQPLLGRETRELHESEDASSGATSKKSPLTVADIETRMRALLDEFSDRYDRTPVPHRSLIGLDLEKVRALAKPFLERALVQSERIRLGEDHCPDALKLALFFQVFEAHDESVPQLLKTLRELESPHLRALADEIEGRLQRALAPHEAFDYWGEDRYLSTLPPLEAARRRWKEKEKAYAPLVSPEKIGEVSAGLRDGNLGPYDAFMKEVLSPDYRALAGRASETLQAKVGAQLKELQELEVEWEKTCQRHPISRHWRALYTIITPDSDEVVSLSNAFNRFSSFVGSTALEHPLAQCDERTSHTERKRLLVEAFKKHIYPSALYGELQAFKDAKDAFDQKICAFLRSHRLRQPEGSSSYYYPAEHARRMLTYRCDELLRGSINAQGPMREQLVEALEELTSLSLLAHNLRQGRLCPVEFNDVGLYDVRGAYNPVYHREQVPHNLLLSADGRLELLNGPNMSGKTFRQKVAFWTTAYALQTGLAPAESVTMPWFDTVMYMDRVAGKDSMSLSSAGHDFANWTKALPFLRGEKRAFVCVDEAFSTMSPRNQQYFTGAAVGEVSDRGHYGIITTHNHRTIDWLTRLTTNIRPCYLKYTVDAATGEIEFARTPVPGHAKSEALAVAKTLGLDL